VLGNLDGADLVGLNDETARRREHAVLYRITRQQWNNPLVSDDRDSLHPAPSDSYILRLSRRRSTHTAAGRSSVTCSNQSTTLPPFFSETQLRQVPPRSRRPLQMGGCEVKITLRDAVRVSHLPARLSCRVRHSKENPRGCDQNQARPRRTTACWLPKSELHPSHHRSRSAR